jgi:hypothetical protein
MLPESQIKVENFDGFKEKKGPISGTFKAVV